jgi:hypothetical protein
MTRFFLLALHATGRASFFLHSTLLFALRASLFGLFCAPVIATTHVLTTPLYATNNLKIDLDSF